jgi:predicted RNase H-like HicB family nuclease
MADHGTLLQSDEAARFIEQIQDPVTKSLVNMAFVHLVKTVLLEKRSFPRSDLDMLFLVSAQTDFFSEHEVIARTLEGERVGAWFDDETLNRQRPMPGLQGEPLDTGRALAQVAEQYRSDGYRVVVRPAAQDVPAFAAGHEVDFIAYKDGEKVLVEVKVSREDLRDDAEAMRMAELVKDQPGWRFDLVVLNPDAPTYKVSADAAEPSVESIEQSLAHAEKMSAAGELQLSCVLSWAALEAAMRQAARAVGVVATNAAPPFLLRALYAQGLLHKNEFHQLSEAMKVRNALVHGMVVPSLSPAIPEGLVRVAKRLLSENGKKVRSYTVVVERCPDTGVYVGYVPGFPGAHSQGETLDELRKNMHEVLTMLMADGEPTLEAEFVGTQTVEVK